VDHSCEKCGSPVPDGRPFCPQCYAPQVRVAIAAPEPAEDISSRAIEVAETTPVESVPPWQPSVDERRVARASVIKAGILGVLLGMIPLLGSVLTGVIAVWFYRRSGGPARGAKLGARVGALAAGLAFTISGMLTVVQVFVLHAQQQSEEAMIKLLEALGANPADPDVQASLHRLFTPEGMVISIVIGLAVAVVLGAFGGAVAAESRPRTRL